MKAAIIMGSTSDLAKVEPAVEILKSYGVEVKVRCLSAHRAHAALSDFIEEINGDGTEAIIAAAGMAAALPGVVASQTVIPVIGVPLSGSNLEGMDALLSDAAGNPSCNRCDKRKQECGTSRTSDHGCKASGASGKTPTGQKGHGGSC